MNAHEHITIDENAMTFIRIKAGQLVGKYGFTASDREDIEQELLLDLLLRRNRYDPSKGRPATYVKVVVQRRVASLIRARTAASRDYRRTQHTLSGVAGEDDNTLSAEQAVDETEREDLRLDLQAAVEALPDDLRALAERLGEDTLAGVARQSRQSREATRRLARVLRRHFSKHGLTNYLPGNHPVHRSRK